jgi:hypothetical protein
MTGSLNVTVADSCYIICPKTRLKVILEYLEEGWLGRAQNRVVGIIFSYDPDADTMTKIREVPDSDVVARIEGSWMDKIYYSLGNAPFAKSAEKILLIDLNPLFPIPKVVPPMEEQLPNESRRFWNGVTSAILEKKYGLATQLKQELEEKQRKRAAERKDDGVEWQVSSLFPFSRSPFFYFMAWLTVYTRAAAILHRRRHTRRQAGFNSRRRKGIGRPTQGRVQTRA